MRRLRPVSAVLAALLVALALPAAANTGAGSGTPPVSAAPADPAGTGQGLDRRPPRPRDSGVTQATGDASTLAEASVATLDAATTGFEVVPATSPAGTVVEARSIEPCPVAPGSATRRVTLVLTDPIGTTQIYAAGVASDGHWTIRNVLVREKALYLTPGNYRFDVTCTYYDSTTGGYTALHSYSTLSYTATQPRRFTVAPATQVAGGTITASMIDSCSTGSTHVQAELYTYASGSYRSLVRTAFLPVAADGTWVPVSVTIPTDVTLSSVVVDIACYMSGSLTLFYSPLVVTVTPVDSLVLVTPLSATVGSTFSFSYQCASGPSLQIFSTDGSLNSSAQLGLPVTGNGLDYSQTAVVQAAGAYVGKLTCGTSIRQSAVFNVQPKRRATLIAMGDSYSSGEGNAPFDEGTDTARNKCHRSSNAWPRYLSRLDASGVHLISHIACSGAVIPSLTVSYKTEPAQLNQLANLARPDIITITLGGNDVGFATVVRNCYLTLNCDKTLVKDAEKAISGPALPLTAVGFDGLVPELTAALQAVEAIRPNARVILVGYPNIFPTSSAAAMRCGWLSEAERVSLVRLAGLLNDAAATAAASAGAEFVTTLDALAGHELCTADSWVVPVGLFTGAQLQQNAHPMALGQFAMAKRLETYLNGEL